MLIVSSIVYSQKITKAKELKIDEFFSNPVPSPDGKYILVTGKQLNGVSIIETKTKKIIPVSIISGSGYAYSWSHDGKSIFFKAKPENGYVEDSEVFEYNIQTKKTEKININHNFLPSYNGKNNIIVYTNIHTLKIEAIDLKTNKSWVVTNTDGQFYSATLSHDGKKVALHEGSNIYVYNIDGSGLIADLGMGIATSWSLDDKYLIGYNSESEDGHEISNSDIYLFDLKKSKSVKLSNSKNLLEANPCFVSKNKIIYSDENTGEIIISKIKL